MHCNSESLLLNSVNVPFPVTCHPGPPECPRDSWNLAWYTRHLASKQLSSQLAHFVTTRDFPRSHHSFWLFCLTSTSYPKRLSHSIQVCSSESRSNSFPLSTLCGFPSYYPGFMCCKWKVNSLKHSDGSPLFPRLRSRDLHHSCHPLPGRIISLLKLPHACATLQCLTLTQLSHLCGLVSDPCCAWSLATNSILSFLFILMEPPLQSQSRKPSLYPVLLRRYFLSACNCPFNLAYVNSLRAGTRPIIPVTTDYLED